ncbi:MAG: L-serine ammonia-lyase [Ilumatobacter sp.]|nr:L-serine ammonia-lyase [Ilumatobacter sp.]
MQEAGEALSVFDMLKVGVGPSSSHTLGPWRAVQRWLGELDDEAGGLSAVDTVVIHLYGSLALTGRGHATDKAIALALLGHQPETVPVESISSFVADLEAERFVHLVPGRAVAFDPATDIVFHPDERLPGHANGMICEATIGDRTLASTYYSIGGGFVLAADEVVGSGRSAAMVLPHPTQTPEELRTHCAARSCRIADVVWSNEQAWRSDDEIRAQLDEIWRVMLDAVYRGCHTDGVLPGGLDVRRRAAQLVRRLLGDASTDTPEQWIEVIRSRTCRFAEVLQLVSAFAMAVNEENADLGRVVTAPTNGAAGVIPAVLMYHVCFSDREVTADEIREFLMVAGEVGTLFKKGATISAAMGGCQAEVGVSSAMAAAALAEALGGSVEQAMMAAEIAMEHHLGMTCDPVAGLVQVPCIERNTMGAIKAINAAELAVAGNPSDAKVSLGDVIRTLRETAEDMSDRYKETSQGGLAINVSVRVPEC